MYAKPGARAPRLDPASLTAAIAINGAAIAALIFSAPETFLRHVDPPLTTYSVPPESIPDPLPPPPEPLPRSQPQSRHVDQPRPLVDLAPSEAAPTLFQGETNVGPGDGVGTGGGVAIDPTPPPPVAVDPVLDQRFAGSFQPDYPADERRMGREGAVVVRVLIGVDGRVKQVEQVSATSDSFFRATMRRALAAWRFKPGTIGGIPVERWRQIRVSFHLEEG